MSVLNLRLMTPALAVLVALHSAAVAQDKLRIAGGLAGTWENSFSELGQNAGFFKKHGLVLEIFYTQGAGETQPGSSTYAAVQGFQRVFGVAFTPVATGSPASTLTQAMTGQIDVGWTSPPFALDLMKEGKIRQIMRASDVPELRNQTARFMTANAVALDARRPVFVRYLQAYREVVDWMYSDKAAIKAFADWARIPEEIAQLAPNDYYPKDNVLPDRIEGLELAMADAASFKYIAAPLSKDQLAKLILVPLK